MFASFGHTVLILPYLVMAWLFSSMLYSGDCDGIKYDTSSTIIFLRCISACSPIGKFIVHNKEAQYRDHHRSGTSHLIWLSETSLSLFFLFTLWKMSYGVLALVTAIKKALANISLKSEFGIIERCINK